MAFTHFNSVFVRELQRIKERPLHVILITLAIVFSYVFFLTLMNEGQPEKLPIAIVDQDGTYLSRRLAHEINATQGVSVAAVYDNHREARKAMQQQKIYAFVDIPANTYADVLAFKRPHISIYINYSYLMGGALSYKTVMTIANLASGAVQREVLRKKGVDENQIMGLIQPVVVDSHFIGNPMANYQSYLLTSILPGILGMFVVLMTTYSIGVELKERTSREWMRCSGNSIIPALLGKLLPYSFWFVLMGVLGNIVLFGFMHFPMNGSFLILTVVTILYVFAMQSLGVLFIGTFPLLRDAVCLSALYSILAFSFSGFTYPIEGMVPAMQSLSYFFPLREYYQAYVNEAIFGAGFTESYLCMVILMIYQLLPFLILTRLQNALIKQNFPIK